MKLKKLLRWSLFIINVIVIIFFLLLLFFLVFGVPEWFYSYAKTSDQSVVVSPQSVFSVEQFWFPVRIQILKLNIDAPVLPVGLTVDGAMDVTNTPYDAAWYKLGPRPGEKGNAVIAGHYGRWKNGAISVFNKLDTLVKGDRISIVDDKGVVISFIVRESKVYAFDADASDVFISNDGISHLNLVTCIQDKITKKYPNRLVVFTDKEVFTGAK